MPAHFPVRWPHVCGQRHAIHRRESSPLVRDWAVGVSDRSAQSNLGRGTECPRRPRDNRLWSGNPLVLSIDLAMALSLHPRVRPEYLLSATGDLFADGAGSDETRGLGTGYRHLTVCTRAGDVVGPSRPLLVQAWDLSGLALPDEQAYTSPTRRPSAVPERLDESLSERVWDRRLFRLFTDPRSARCTLRRAYSRGRSDRIAPATKTRAQLRLSSLHDDPSPGAVQ